MKSKEKKAILILVVVSVIIIGVTWYFTRGRNNDVGGNAGGGQVANNPTSGQVANNSSSNSSASQGEFTKNEGDKIVNTSEKLKENKEESGLLMTGISFEEANGETVLRATITNNTETVQASFFGNIVLLDKSGNEIGRIPVRVSEMQAGEIRDIEASITESYANAYDFKLVKE